MPVFSRIPYSALQFYREIGSYLQYPRLGSWSQSWSWIHLDEVVHGTSKGLVNFLWLSWWHAAANTGNRKWSPSGTLVAVSVGLQCAMRNMLFIVVNPFLCRLSQVPFLQANVAQKSVTWPQFTSSTEGMSQVIFELHVLWRSVDSRIHCPTEKMSWLFTLLHVPCSSKFRLTAGPRQGSMSKAKSRDIFWSKCSACDLGAMWAPRRWDRWTLCGRHISWWKCKRGEVAQVYNIV